jgi:hypothetical protein
MNAEKIIRMEKLLDRKLSEDEITRLRRIKDVLGISDSDAIWDVLTAMEYQRFYYDELPQKIAGVSAEILKKLGTVQGNGSSPSRLSPFSRPDTVVLLPLAFMFLAALLFYGSMLLWAGFCIGSGRTHPPEVMLLMPSGLILGGLCLMGGLFLGVRAAKDFAEGGKGWRKQMIAASTMLVPGGVMVSLTL